MNMTYKIAVVGLGYVGLPVAVGAARHFENVIGFDINKSRIKELQSGYDQTGELSQEELKAVSLTYTANPDDLDDKNFFIVTVPTPIDKSLRPDLKPIEASCRTIGPYLKKGAIVVFESTVYPGVTEEVAGPLLEEISGLKAGADFKLGYSPERINPGDKVRRLETITKIISAQDEESLNHLENVYGKIVTAGLHKAPTIKVAEAAKVIENTQRDLNIALMNELSLIFDKLDIRTKDVLEAAGTKWNFLPFTPGLVGGHCIGVDPYYLTAKAESVGYHPQVILAGRRINDNMGKMVAQKTIKLLGQKGLSIKDSKIGIMGLTFKENVPDLRNSRVPDIIEELKTFNVQPLIYEPEASAKEADSIYNIKPCGLSEMKDLDAIIFAVSHQQFLEMGASKIQSMFKDQNGVFIDVKSAFKPSDFGAGVTYWSL